MSEEFAVEGAAMTDLYFQGGMIFDHLMRRTITESDNALFSTMTHNPSALHLDPEYMKKSQYGQQPRQ